MLRPHFYPMRKPHSETSFQATEFVRLKGHCWSGHSRKVWRNLSAAWWVKTTSFSFFFVRDKRTLLLQARALTRRTEIPRVPNSFTAWTTREEKGAATESPKLFCMLSRVSRSSPMGRKPHGSDVAPSASPHWGHASRYPAMNLVIKQAIFSLRKHLVGPPDRSCLPGVVQRHRY